MIFGTKVALCILLAVFVFSELSFSQRANRRPKIEILREIDLEEGQQRLNSFRRLWIIGDFSLRYSLQFIPRRGERQEVMGTIWSTNTVEGPVSLINIHGEPETQLYLKNGPDALVQRRQSSTSEWAKVGTAEWFNPVDKSLTITPFDLMMPFIYWDDWNYEGVTKIRGRVAHAFLMLAPDYLLGNPWGLFGVVVYLDEDFNALLKANYISEDELILKSFRLLDLKKVNDVWLPKTVDFLDENSRDKTRVQIKQAAVHRDFSEHELATGELPTGVPEIPLFDYVDVR